MKIKKQDGPPEDLLYFDEEVDRMYAPHTLKNI